ncbi:MAG TPA: AAA family ATPase [Acidimicrobiales bacterium]|nr:AAA family ATPase [Acidimicrobiales bacterium]
MNRQGNRGDRRRSLIRAAQADASGSPVGTPSLDTAPVDAPPSGLASAGDTDAAVALRSLGQAGVMGVTTADVGAHRERVRQGKMRRLALLLVPVAVWLVVRATVLHRGPFGLPHFPSGLTPYLPAFILISLFACMMIIPLLGAGRSPHILYRPNEIDVRFDDVRGAPVVVDEVVKTLNLFLAHRAFAEHMGGSARRAILFEGPPGTGKTYMAKAMAAEAGVPFLFVSSSAFQSMFYGQTNRKIRSYFRELRNYARREGGAIGFIEEIDAIGGARGGMGTGRHHDGVAGVVNELLIQLQSFDQPPRSIRMRGAIIDIVNAWLPPHHHLHKPANPPANILVIGATNRAADLDPALVRPGRFDRSIYFDLPSKSGRRDILDYYLAKKAHEPELDDPVKRDTLAAMTFGYSPVMLEHLLDEALVWALRRNGTGLGWDDIQQAKMTEEIGLAQPVEYAEAERRTIATHESGHATVAWLVGKGRKMEVLSIIKRKDALGLLSHSEEEERYTKTRSEIEALIQIAFGGMVAEELFFGETSSGVAADLQAATVAACQMVGSLGMGNTLISAAALDVPGNIVTKVTAIESSREEVERLLRDAKGEVRTMLEDNRHVVEALRDALLDRDELVGKEILDVIASAGPVASDIKA